MAYSLIFNMRIFLINLGLAIDNLKILEVFDIS
jgi:hypothetical protein